MVMRLGNLGLVLVATSGIAWAFRSCKKTSRPLKHSDRHSVLYDHFPPLQWSILKFVAGKMRENHKS